MKLSFVKSGDKKAAIKSGDKNRAMKKTEKQMQEILEYMTPDKEYRTAEIATNMGIKNSRARELMKNLVKQGKIKAIGKNKGRRYIRE